MALKQDYLHTKNSQMEDWRKKLDELQTQVQEATATTRMQLNHEIQALRQKQEAAQEKLKQLQDSGEEAWEEVQTGVENAWDDLTHAYYAAKDKMR